MYFDLDKLSKNALTRHLQLRVLMALQIIFELVVEHPTFTDLVALEKRLIDVYYFLLENIYHPNK